MDTGVDGSEGSVECDKEGIVLEWTVDHRGIIKTVSVGNHRSVIGANRGRKVILE